MSEVTVPSIPLGPTVAIPQVGFGVYQVPEPECATVVREALAVGYRHLDTATLYANEAGVGRGLAESGIPRDEVFLTTKVWNDAAQSRDGILRSFDDSMTALGLEVLDLYLVHWPVPRTDRYVAAWRTLLELRESGRVRAVGVCNFQPDHLRRLAAETGELPAINQIELNPYFQQRALRAVNAELGIVTQAWAPLQQGGDLLTDPVVVRIAERLDVTAGQVILRWHVQHGIVVIPKSVHTERMRSNLDLFGFALDADDMTALDGLDRGIRMGPDPDVFDRDVP